MRSLRHCRVLASSVASPGNLRAALRFLSTVRQSAPLARRPSPAAQSPHRKVRDPIPPAVLSGIRTKQESQGLGIPSVRLRTDRITGHQALALEAITQLCRSVHFVRIRVPLQGSSGSDKMPSGEPARVRS